MSLNFLVLMIFGGLNLTWISFNNHHYDFPRTKGLRKPTITLRVAHTITSVGDQRIYTKNGWWLLTSDGILLPSETDLLARNKNTWAISENLNGAIVNYRSQHLQYSCPPHWPSGGNNRSPVAGGDQYHGPHTLVVRHWHQDQRNMKYEIWNMKIWNIKIRNRDYISLLKYEIWKYEILR